MTTEPEKDTQKKIPTQPPLPDFYMPAMPPTELITDLAKWVKKLYLRYRQRK